MILSSHGIIASSGGFIVPPLLDDYPNAAAAYSLRKLRSAYTGSAIQVRRASDNTTQNIGFTALGALDTTSLTSFCSGTNGFVTTWYDQSGNTRNATQTTAINQPQIVSSGSVILENGKPTLQNTASTGLKTVSVGLSTFANLSLFTVYRQTSTLESLIFETSTDFNTSGNGNILITQVNQDFNTLQKTSTYLIVNHNNVSLNQQIISTYLKASTTASDFSDVYGNNSLLAQTVDPILRTNSVPFANNILSLFSRNASSLGLIGNYQELILYPSNQVSNNSNINSNINDFYSIY
jgi:hypothetical protein